MKHFLCILIFIITINGSTQAQGKHEVFIGYGIFNTSEFINSFSNIIVTGITGGQYESRNSKSIGTLQAGYKYLLTDHIAVGGTYTYTHNRSDAVFNKEKIGKFTNNYHTLAAEADYRYISKPKFSLYSSVGIGATLYSQKFKPNTGENKTNNEVNVDFQVSLLGIKFGERIGFFAEAGFGYKGLINAGAFIRL